MTEQRRPKSIVMSFGSVQAVRLHQLCSPRYSWGWCHAFTTSVPAALSCQPWRALSHVKDRYMTS